MPETALPPTDLDLISLLKAIPDPRMLHGIRIPAWYLLPVAVLGILSRCRGLRDLKLFAIRHHSVLTEVMGIEFRRPRPIRPSASFSAKWTWRLSALPSETGRSPKSPLLQLISINWPMTGKTLRGSIERTAGVGSAFIAEVKLYSAALCVAISQACYATSQDHARAVFSSLSES